MARLRIGELLVSAKVITDEQLQQALATPRTGGRRLGDVLVQMGMVTEAQLTQLLGQQLSVPWVSLYHIDFSRQLLNLVPHEIAEKYGLIPIFVRRLKKQDTLYVAMDDPTNDQALAEVASYAGLPVKPMIAAPSDIRSAIKVYYGTGEISSGSMIAAAPVASPPAAAAVPPPVKPPLPTPKKKEEKKEAPSQPKPSASGDSPDASPEIEAKEITIPRPRAVPMIALTLLDGSTIHLPARRAKKDADAQATGTKLDAQSKAADVVRALRAVGEGADAKDVLGDDPRWPPVLLALLSAMFKKGVVADAQLVEELKALGVDE